MEFLTQTVGELDIGTASCSRKRHGEDRPGRSAVHRRSRCSRGTRVGIA